MLIPVKVFVACINIMINVLRNTGCYGTGMDIGYTDALYVSSVDLVSFSFFLKPVLGNQF